MRFMILVKATKDSEAGAPPSQELLEAMMTSDLRFVTLVEQIGKSRQFREARGKNITSTP